MSNINIYICASQHKTITRDTPNRDVTPFKITCPDCGHESFSRGYEVSQDLIPTYEWFIPQTVKEYKDACVPIYGDVFTDEDYESMLDKKSTMYRKIK